ncbi:hypothetical protein CBS147333_7885 [Penicillium roqueforti]|nr:hypothetical protein CBS147372_9618 [Penicillium roqueforti]KAI3102401.1 hypothetical protein CBS147333_7885 [Penicillium roqueforti]KAI3146403.1 hypothetical protein CBS147317_9184 [Penicillium roqueforti]KAI3186298.1 hypothetical protein CBS147311_10274 [Penicillium roqueforti]KAI3260279.1 hypothetical protein CBS147308_10306 [Penicillium roqueforti]
MSNHRNTRSQRLPTIPQSDERASTEQTLPPAANGPPTDTSESTQETTILLDPTLTQYPTNPSLLTLEQLRKRVKEAKAREEYQNLLIELEILEQAKPPTLISANDRIALQVIEKYRIRIPREPANVKPFHGNTTQEYYTFINRLQSHFDKHQQ